ncbi:hypothetical protein SESBI_27405 [Sesbania bispinosa]|nr:hypothetical protein SESBI_27405 [Sesbania bispinosa]
MADCVQTRATNLANHVHDAVEEVNSNPEIKLPWKTFRLMKFCQDVVRRKIINQPSKVYPRHPYRTRYQVRMMEDLTDLTLENEELKKEIKQMRAEMDKMSESMRIMEKQNAEGTSTVKQMTQMFEAMQKSAEKRPMVDTTETAATPDYPPGFTQGLMPVIVHLNKPVQQVDPPEVQWPLYGLPPNYTPPIVNNASDQTAKPQGSDAKVADSQITPPQVEEEEQCMRRRVEEVKTPLRVIFKELCKAGWVNGNIAGDGMCGLHSDTDHTIEDCEEFKRMLQDMMDRKLVQIGCGGNIVDVSVIDYSASTSPKPLVVHYTRDAAVRTTNRPIPITIQVPTSFPYKDNKAVPWRYDVEVLVGDRQVAETNVDTPNVTNIAGVGGMTRSGRIYTPDEFRTTQSTLEIAHATYKKPIFESQPSDALMMVARVMLENGVSVRTRARKRLVEEEEEKRLARLGGERDTQGDVNNNWVRVGPPDAMLPYWEIIELPVIFNFK